MTITELLDKTEDFERLSQKEQVKLISFFFSIETQTDTFLPKQIADCFVRENLKLPANIGREFSRLTEDKPATFVRKGTAYGFERNQKKELETNFFGSAHTKNVSGVLRGLLPKVGSSEQKVFLEEAISCFEIKSYRAAIIMSWLLSIDTLYDHIVQNRLDDFNTAIQMHGKYKKLTIKKKDNFSDIKESDFIELLRVSKIISNDTRKILDEKLDFRNTCAHPNSIIIKESKAISFIDDLVENIVLKF